MLQLSNILRQYIDGVPGETIFHQPVSDLIAGIEDQFKQDGITAALARMGKYGDERSKVLLAALVSEAVVEMMLKAFMPRYKNLFTDSSGFHVKISALEALAVVPTHLTDAARMICAARNKFAHKLTIEKLDDLPDQSKRDMKDYYDKRKIDPANRRDDIGHVFNEIAYIATAGLASYISLVRDMNETIRNPAFEKRLRKQAKKRQNEQAEAILKIVNAPAPDRSDSFF